MTNPREGEVRWWYEVANLLARWEACGRAVVWKGRFHRHSPSAARSCIPVTIVATMATPKADHPTHDTHDSMNIMACKQRTTVVGAMDGGVLMRSDGGGVFV